MLGPKSPFIFFKITSGSYIIQHKMGNAANHTIKPIDPIEGRTFYVQPLAPLSAQITGPKCRNLSQIPLEGSGVWPQSGV